MFEKCDHRNDWLIDWLEFLVVTVLEKINMIECVTLNQILWLQTSKTAWNSQQPVYDISTEFIKNIKNIEISNEKVW